MELPGFIDNLPWIFKTRWFLHMLTTALVAPYVTLISHSLLRRKFWEDEKQPDVQKFYEEINELLDHVSGLHNKTLSTRDVQRLVRKIAGALSRSYFGTDEPPAPTNIPRIDVDKIYNCRVCKGKEEDVEVTAFGQCLKCKLYLAVWDLKP
jgi:hypothetical protein